MAEAILKPFDPPRMAAPAGVPPRAVNGVRLRWEAGPDELRLPCSEADPMPQNARQAAVTIECFDSLEARWEERPDVGLGFDQFVYWDRDYDRETNKAHPPLAPDLYVAFGVANRPRKVYVVWEERKPPDFVLEVVSPSSRRRDDTEKPRLYAKMGVPEFFRYDPYGKLKPALAGFRLRRGKCPTYRRVRRKRLPNGALGVPSKALGLYLCIRPAGLKPTARSLVWYDPVAGEFLPTRSEMGARAVAAEARADASDARAEVSDARAEAAEATAEAAVAKMAASDAKAAASEARGAELEAQIEKMRRERG